MVFVLLATLMCSSFGAVLATNAGSDGSQGSGISLEEFCHLYAQYMSNGDAAEYERIYSQLTSTEITVTVSPTVPYANDKAVSQPELSDKITASTQTTRGANYWIVSATASPYMYDTNGNLIGYVNNVQNIVGSPNSNHVKLVTTGWSINPLYPNNRTKDIAGEALTNGSFGGNLRTGPIEVAGVYTDQPGWDNFLIVQYYIGSWQCLPAQKVTGTSSSQQTLTYGGITAKFTNISVSCMTMPPGTAGTPVMKNSIFVDAAGATS